MKDYKDLISELRTKQSRDNRKLLDDAADAIERLQRERNAAVSDLETALDDGICRSCKKFKDDPFQMECIECYPGGENNFEWRGVDENN